MTTRAIPYGADATEATVARMSVEQDEAELTAALGQLDGMSGEDLARLLAQAE